MFAVCCGTTLQHFTEQTCKVWRLRTYGYCLSLQFSKAFQGLPQDRIEEAFDRFAREEFRQGHQIVKEGEPISKMYIVKMGELACTRGGQPVSAIQEAGGFSYFGEQAVLANEPSPVTITVQSESCLLLGASRRALAQLMGQGPAVMGISADDAALASSALKATAVLQDLNDTEIKVRYLHIMPVCIIAVAASHLSVMIAGYTAPPAILICTGQVAVALVVVKALEL